LQRAIFGEVKMRCGRFVLQCENAAPFSGARNSPPPESRIGAELYEMLILGARTRGEKAKTAGHRLGGDARPAALAGCDFPSSRGRGAAVRSGSCGARNQEGYSMSESNDQAHWAETSKLMWITLAIWVFFGYIIHMFVNVLNSIVILGFPLGFYMGAQGSLIAFVVLLFWFARKQDQIDQKYGVAED
jgi:putative solute:sodium symporter small subunit